MSTKLKTSAKLEPPYKRFGALLTEARKNRKLTQGQLAERLGVQQQAVSRWERGTSRPETPKAVTTIAALFPERDWFEATGHAQYPPSTLSHPVRPLISTLPLQDLNWDQFEDFCTALVTAYFDGAIVHRYGVAGDAQRGVDIDARFADGRRYTFQCKQVQKFGKDNVRRAIAEHAVDSDLAVILLSRSATVGARNEIKRRRKQKWDLWDARDIAERIRALPSQKSLRLIDTYFPGHRKDFLGIDHASAFEMPEKYFAPFLKQSHIFSHTWTLVGREKERVQIKAALNGQNEGALVIAGAGGIGKTRLLRAVLDDYHTEHPHAPIFILPSTAQPTAKDYDILSEQEGLVVIEDAHDREDMKAVAHVLARLKVAQRVIVTCRPYALSATRGDLESAGLLVTPGFPIQVGGLSASEAEAVAREILKVKGGPLGTTPEDIANVTHDSPLALVIGTHLVATKLINPRTLNNADEFRHRLLEGFRDAITGTIGLANEQQTIRGTLELVALLQPVEVDTNSFAAIAAKLTRQPVPEIKRGIQLLLEAGVLVRKARKLRIVPDLLGDYLIEEVLRREGGPTSTTAQQLLVEADAQQVAHLLVNTAKVDWRLSAKDDGARRLSDIVWNLLISNSTDPIPDKLLEGIATAAYYQPEPALRLYDRLASKNATPEEFTLLLKHVAMNMDFVERACERLWALARNDDRPENQHPGQPMRILKELATIEPAKPVEFSERIARFAMRRLAERQDTLPLYGVLEAALRADGHTTESTGLSITVRHFAIRHEAVRELRQEIIGFLLQQLTAAFLPSAVRAAAVLHAALRYPGGTEADVRKTWEEEFTSTLDRIAALVRTGALDPNTLVAIEESVSWHARFDDGPVHDAVERLLAAIPQTLDYRVTLCMVDAWGNTRMGQDDARWIERWRAEQTDVAQAALRQYSEPTALLAFIRAKLEAIRASDVQRDNNPGQFVGILASLDESIATAVCDVATNDSGMRPLFSASLFALLRLNPTQGITAAITALATGIVELARAVAWCLSARQGSQQTLPDERALLQSLLSHADPYVVSHALRGIVSGGLSDIPALVATLLQVNLRDSKQVASEFFGEIIRHDSLASALTAENVVPSMLSKIKDLPTIEDFWIEKYLCRVAEVAPLLLVDFLIDRIMADIGDTEHKLQPLPYLWDEKLPFSSRKSPRFTDALRRICEWMLNAPNQWPVQFWAPKLYVAVAGGVDDEIVRDFLEWTSTHDAARFAVVVNLLREAPSGFALNHLSAVRNLFDRAEMIGEEAVRGLRSSLFAATISGMRHGTLGQPFPEDVRRKTKSQEALTQLPAGSPVAELYIALARDAEGDIRRQKEEDDALIEEYE